MLDSGRFGDRRWVNGEYIPECVALVRRVLGLRGGEGVHVFGWRVRSGAGGMRGVGWGRGRFSSLRCRLMLVSFLVTGFKLSLLWNECGLTCGHRPNAGGCSRLGVRAIP